MEKSFISSFIPFGSHIFEYFNDIGDLIKSGKFRYLMLVTQGGDLKMLLTFEHHAEALFDYMKINQISEIKLYGGGKIYFSFQLTTIYVSEKSSAFGSANKQEVYDFLKKDFQAFRVNTNDMMADSDLRKTKLFGKVFTIDEVEKAKHQR